MKEYKAEDYRMIVYESTDKDGFIAEIEELSTIGDGATPEEAIADLLQVANEKLKIAYELSAIVNPPFKMEPTFDYSGKILLRLPKALHRQIAQQAERESCSINQLMLSYISYGLGYDQIMESKSEVVVKKQENIRTECDDVYTALLAHWKEYSSKYSEINSIYINRENHFIENTPIREKMYYIVESHNKQEFKREEKQNKPNIISKYVEEIKQNYNNRSMEGMLC